MLSINKSDDKSSLKCIWIWPHSAENRNLENQSFLLDLPAIDANHKVEKLFIVLFLGYVKEWN